MNSTPQKGHLALNEDVSVTLEEDCEGVRDATGEDDKSDIEK